MVADQLERRDLRGMHRRLRQHDRARRRAIIRRSAACACVDIERPVRKAADGQRASAGDLGGLTPFARSRNTLHGSFAALCVDHSRAPLQSKARANVGSPPCMKSIAAVVMTPLRAARLASRAAAIRSAEATLTEPRLPLRLGASGPQAQARRLWRSGTLPDRR